MFMLAVRMLGGGYCGVQCERRFIVAVVPAAQHSMTVSPPVAPKVRATPRTLTYTRQQRCDVVRPVQMVTANYPPRVSAGA